MLKVQGLCCHWSVVIARGSILRSVTSVSFCLDDPLGVSSMIRAGTSADASSRTAGSCPAARACRGDARARPVQKRKRAEDSFMVPVVDGCCWEGTGACYVGSLTSSVEDLLNLW